jgi:mono/diheme cytochrome c family protein
MLQGPVTRALLVGVAMLWAGCSRPGGPDSFTQSEFPIPKTMPPPTPSGTGGNTVMPGAAICSPAQTSQRMPARSSLTTAGGPAPTQPTYFTADLFALFKSVCGGCHVESNLGGFQVTATTFPTLVDQSIYEVVTSDDPATFMPPPTYGGIPFHSRPASDAQVQLANLLQIWLAAGSPAQSFDLPADPNSAPAAGYVVTTTMSSEITNLGTCIPDKAMVGMDLPPMDQLDAFFAQATSLPPTLDLTDFTTLDSEALAKTGVISYAPTYPLWSDNAGKMRYVRVPRNQSIVFDKTTQQFQIPPNTRFYKTFLKSVVDADGNPAYRKIETRLIVARPDMNNSDGTVTQTALFGTYVWNDDESQATLLTDPLRDGKPFADRLFTYITDESKAQPIIDSNPKNLADKLNSAGLTRHYALPGSERCVECHMGSPSQSFVLGFTPLQVARRPTGEGGVYEPAMGDELTQLQRLIDYGVITGVKSSDDILPLENSEGSRQPRNVYELDAQAYMVGNCAHCHNPRGFPSTKEPLLANVLIFLPGTGPNEGIFQMPLTLNSPVRKRGINHDIDIPYISPSLYDIDRVEALPKYFCPDQAGGNCNGTKEAPSFVLAPWRSLIYRNVDTPYDYFDDSAPFPHMPLNSPGYDCRAAGIMGDWMVSIPATRKDSTKLDTVLPVGDENGDLVYPPNADTDPQPYVESLPGDAAYPAAVAGASARLASYHTGGFRYGFCPDTYTKDIVDPFTEEQVNKNQPVTSDTGLIYDPHNLNKVIMPVLSPIRPNWVDFDDTDPPGDWFPRRPDWADALVNPDVTGFVNQAEQTDYLSADAAEDLTNVLQALSDNFNKVALSSDVVAATTQPLPFGLWDTSIKGCDFSSIPKASSYQGAARPTWMAVAPPDPNAPVYVESYGSAVFNTVCFNCHGVNADSKGLLADEITLLTGGDARVADFRDGLFGPVTQPGANRDRVFGDSAATLGITADDLAARYMAWMALGGTSKHLPDPVLNQVSESPVLGTLRQHIALSGTPDMLRVALNLCEQVLASDPSSVEISLSDLVANSRYSWGDFSGLIDTNGDADMWLHLCNLNNRAVVRVPVVSGGAWSSTTSVGSDLTISGYSLYWGTGPNGEDYYGANPVMDHLGNIKTGLTADNFVPLCVQKPSSAAELQNANKSLAATKINGNVIPFCPDSLIQDSNQLQVSGYGDHVDGRKWAARGAINAALAVFLYLDGIERNPSTRPIPFNQCNLLGSK